LTVVNREKSRHEAITMRRIPQLHMRHLLENLPELTVPDDYALRTLTPEDWHSWTMLMQENGELGEWTIDRSAPLFAPGSSLIFDGSFFATWQGEPVATAQINRHADPTYGPEPELGWVAASPRHRGHGLGYAVCLAVLRYATAAGFPSIFLRTDDHRSPAIRTYLKLGFEPWLFDSTAAERWRAIQQRLDG
jgi:mycothiol synthase